MAENPLSPDVQKRLKLMRFWLFGTFAIVFVAVTVWWGLFVGIQALRDLLPLYIILAVLCGGVGIGYEYWMRRKQ